MEIGSVIELDRWELYEVPEEKKVFRLPFMKNTDYQTVLYQSGRNAIESLLCFLKQKRNIQKILLPDYMCETVKDACIRAGLLLEYYGIDRDYNFKIEEVEEKISKDTCLYIAHYFGKKMGSTVLKKVLKWKKQEIIIIEDITLSLFSSDKDESIGFGNYTLGSIRKWLPVPDGGFVSSCTDELPLEIAKTCVSRYTDYYFAVQRMKKEYIQGGCQDKKLKQIYMSYYALSIEELFSDYNLYPISDWTKNYLINYEWQEIWNKRISNYDYLYNRISQINGINVAVKREEGYLPLGMVIHVEERDKLLQYLIKNDIYCNVHWRLNSSKNNPEVDYLSQHSITIPCDQRYDLEEMTYIINILENWKDDNI